MMTSKLKGQVACFMSAALAAVLSAPASAGSSPSMRPVTPSQHLAVRILRSSGPQVNWPQYGLDAGHSGNNTQETDLGTDNVGQLQQAWSFSSGSENIVGDVVAYDGLVFAPSKGGTLFALSASTGQEVWRFDSGNGFRTSGSPPAINDGKVFTVCTLATQQGICALSASTGALQWSYAFPGSASFAATPPVVSGGNVYFEICASNSTCRYDALNEEGDVEWSVSAGGCAPGAEVIPSVLSGLAYMPGGCGVPICTLDALTGGQMHCYPFGSWTLYGLSVTLNELTAMIYDFQSPGVEQLIAQPAWSPGILSIGGKNLAFISYPVSDSTLVYVFTIFDSGGKYVEAFKLKKMPRGQNGQVWRSSATSSPSEANGVIYAACSASGSPCAYDARHGALLWGPGADDGTSSVPIIVNGAVYSACNRSEVCGYTLPGMIRHT